MVLNSKVDVEEMEHVDIIASGYEWDCPNCEHLNLVIEVTDVVECDECHNLYATNPTEHAVGTRRQVKS